MPFVPYTYLDDGGGGIWLVRVDLSALIQTVNTPGGTPSSTGISLNDSAVLQTWNLSVTTGGLLQTTAIAYDPLAPFSFVVNSPDVQVWAIGIANGLLTTSPGTYIPNPITDQYVANDIIYAMLENGQYDANLTLLTSMFTLQEIVDAMNRVQQQFLLETGMITTRTTIAGITGQGKYSVPVDSIRPRRLTWTGPGTTTQSLTQVDTWELDNGASTWPSDRGVPIAWWETTLPQQQVGIALSPNTAGTIGLLYIALATTLTDTGVLFAVPNDWLPYIFWGTLHDLLSSDGQSYDPVRAQYCDQRFQEGIELANLVLGGPQ